MWKAGEIKQQIGSFSTSLEQLQRGRERKTLFFYLHENLKKKVFVGYFLGPFICTMENLKE
jgi:hypothetical protein